MSDQSPQNGPAPGPPAPSATRSAGFAPQVMARAPAPAFIPPAVGGATSQIVPSPFAQPPAAQPPFAQPPLAQPPIAQPPLAPQPPAMARIAPPDTEPMFDEGRGTLPAPEPTGAAALPFVAPPPLMAPPAPPPPAYAVPPPPAAVHNMVAVAADVTPPPVAAGSALPFAQAPAASAPGLAFAAAPAPSSEAGLAFAAPPSAPQAAAGAPAEEADDLLASRWAQPARIAAVELPSNFAPVAAPAVTGNGKAAPPPKASEGHGRTLVIVLSVLAVAVIIALGVVYKMSTREGSNDPISIGVLLGSTPDEPAPTVTASASAAPKPVYTAAPKKKKDNEDFYEELEKK